MRGPWIKWNGCCREEGALFLDIKERFHSKFLQSRANCQNVLSKNIVKVIFNIVKVYRGLSTFYTIEGNDTQSTYVAISRREISQGIKKIDFLIKPLFPFSYFVPCQQFQFSRQNWNSVRQLAFLFLEVSIIFCVPCNRYKLLAFQ